MSAPMMLDARLTDARLMDARPTDARPTDARLTPARDDVAASTLEGRVAAARFLQPRPMQLAVAAAALRSAPDGAAEQLDQLLLGERFDVLETTGGFAFGQARRDGYVGYVDPSALAELGPAPTHWVRALRTFAFAEPSLKTKPLACLSMNALVAVEAEAGPYRKLAGSGWVYADHLAALGDWEDDPARVAERYLGAPYLWGGRDSLGLDCSGLVQQALYACGRAAPRDSDMQQALGQGIAPEAAPSALQRNDLVFWRGHVGIMLDGERMLHANGHHMAVAIEPVTEAVRRIAAAGSGDPVAYRRLAKSNVAQPGYSAIATSQAAA